MTTAFIFDLDGTLVDLPINYEPMFGEFKQIIGVKEVRPILKTVSEISDGQVRKRVFDTWERYELAVVQRAFLHEEGIRIYRAHEDKPMGLVTMQGRKATKILTDKFKLQFKAVITREDSLSRIEQLKLASERLEAPLRDILFVGNMDNDEEAAKSAGCQFRRVK